AQSRIGNHQIEIESNRVAESLTSRTRAEWVIEAEEARLRRGVHGAVVLAFEAFRETQMVTQAAGLLRLHAGRVRTYDFNLCLAMTLAKTRFQRVNQSLPHIRARDQTINEHINIFKVFAPIVIG